MRMSTIFCKVVVGVLGLVTGTTGAVAVAPELQPSPRLAAAAAHAARCTWPARMREAAAAAVTCREDDDRR